MTARTELTAQHTHLYYVWWTCWDSCYGHPDGGGCDEVRTCEVTRVTKKRIYFRDSCGSKWRQEQEYFVDHARAIRTGRRRVPPRHAPTLVPGTAETA